MSVDILYVSFNRLEFTKATFTALRDNTDWTQVRTVYIADDGSTDGSEEWLMEQISGERWYPIHTVVNTEPLGGPVAAMNWYLDNAPDGIGVFAKIDNDMVVCPGWLETMSTVLSRHPGLDILGMEPFVGDPTMPPAQFDITECEHIGGKGLIRTRAFSQCRPVPGGDHGYQGFTQWQHKHPEVTKAWITPDLPVFGLDQVRWADGPWRSLAEEYHRLGWQRLWPVYGGDEHYKWWTDTHGR